MITGDTLEGRKALLEAGFEPILIADKRPCVGDGWQIGEITSDRLADWEADHAHRATGTGLRTGRLVVIDLDVWEAEQTEDLKAATFGLLGPTPYVRIGAKGCQLLYRQTEEPLNKIQVRGRIEGGPPEDAGRKRSLVEILGAGNQTAAFGIHPDTGEPFTWPELDPLAQTFEDLPPVTRGQVRKVVTVLRDHLSDLEAEGLVIGGDIGEVIEIHAGNGAPVTVAMLRDMFALLDPGDYPRAEWVGMLGIIAECPLVDEYGREAKDFAREAFADEWSSGRLGGFEPSNYVDYADVEKAYDSLRGGRGGKTLGSLINDARAAGYAGPTCARTAEEITRSATVERFYGNLALAVDNTAPQPQTEDQPRPFKLRSEAVQDAAPEPVWLIPQVIQEETLTLFYGPENCFKSFLALDLALSAAAGQAWAAYGGKDGNGGYAPAQPLTVVYIAGEGSKGIEKRRRPAWRAAHGIDGPLPFYTVENMPEFGSAKQVEDLAEEIEAEGIKPDLIIVDTVARALTGLDENSVKDTGVLVAGLDYLKRRFRCALLALHHTGHNQNRARGSSNLPAAFDARFAVKGDLDKLLIWVKHEKSKDGEPLDGTLTFEGTQEAGSLVFRRVAPERAQAMNKDAQRVSEVRAALEAMGADKQMVATAWLAKRIIHTRLEADPAADGKATPQDIDRLTRNEARVLQRQVKDRKDGQPGLLAKFVVGAKSGGDLSWTLPANQPDD